MVTNCLNYNNYFNGILINENIMTDISCLNALIISLHYYNADLISFNN